MAGAWGTSWGKAWGVSWGGLKVGKRFKHRAKGYLKRGHKVLVFPSQKEADEFEAAEVEAQQAITKAQRKRLWAEIKPVETINIDRVARQANEWKLPYDIPKLATAFDFETLLLIKHQIEQMLDEEDIELLLIA